MPVEHRPSEEKRELPKVERITIADLAPEMPEIDGTAIILQRNAKDNRDPQSPLEMGALIPDAARAVERHTRESIDRMLRALPPEERGAVDFLVVAADTMLDTPIPGVKSHQKRAVATAAHVLAGIQASMTEYGLTPTQLLNKTGKPVELSSGKLRDLRMFEDTPEFVRFLTEKYGTGQAFWAAFENDDERAVREQMGAEGPDDIARRVEHYIALLMRAMTSYHHAHPERRVIVWAVSHYDTISPYVKKSIVGMEKTDYLPVDQGAGIVITVKQNETASTKIQGKMYPMTVSAEQPATRHTDAPTQLPPRPQT
ncbi:hypothetical protein HY629_02280 [Candidatus Uhrbacteria bacterium]|nr:hypothetical protein [Candidatus Uhrbacteria bacterium]